MRDVVAQRWRHSPGRSPQRRERVFLPPARAMQPASTCAPISVLLPLPLSTMAINKRKRSQVEEDDPASSDFSIVPQDDSDFSGSEDSVDISTALVGNKKRKTSTKNISRTKAPAEDEDVEDDDDVLQGIIRDSMVKRDVKEGTEVMKKTKGKNKLVKGEIGGGSFQSIGACSYFCFLQALKSYY